MSQALVRDHMTRNVAVIRRDQELHELERLLLDEKVHGMPVTDDAGRLVGVVSQTDLLAWYSRTRLGGTSFYDDRSGPDATETELEDLKVTETRAAKVGELMSPLVYCIAPERPIAEAAAMMIEKWIHRVVVVDPDLHVLGIISAIDLLHSIPGTAEALQRSRDERATRA